jgi:hypothetical protein
MSSPVWPIGLYIFVVNLVMEYGWMDVWMSSSTPACGPQNWSNVHHGLSLISQSLIFVFVLGLRTKQFLCFMYLVKIVWSYQNYSYSCFFKYQLIVGIINPSYNSNSRLVLNPSFPAIALSVKLNRPPKPEESQQDLNFNGKNHTLPEIWTRNLWVSSQ